MAGGRGVRLGHANSEADSRSEAASFKNGTAEMRSTRAVWRGREAAKAGAAVPAGTATAAEATAWQVTRETRGLDGNETVLRGGTWCNMAPLRLESCWVRRKRAKGTLLWGLAQVLNN